MPEITYALQLTAVLVQPQDRLPCEGKRQARRFQDCRVSHDEALQESQGINLYQSLQTAVVKEGRSCGLNSLQAQGVSQYAVEGGLRSAASLADVRQLFSFTVTALGLAVISQPVGVSGQDVVDEKEVEQLQFGEEVRRGAIAVVVPARRDPAVDDLQLDQVAAVLADQVQGDVREDGLDLEGRQLTADGGDHVSQDPRGV